MLCNVKLPDCVSFSLTSSWRITARTTLVKRIYEDSAKVKKIGGISSGRSLSAFMRLIKIFKLMKSSRACLDNDCDPRQIINGCK